jgi:hypothetical protein
MKTCSTFAEISFEFQRVFEVRQGDLHNSRAAGILQNVDIRQFPFCNILTLEISLLMP